MRWEELTGDRFAEAVKEVDGVCLIALSVWPALVSQSSFPGDEPTRVVAEGFE